MFGAVHRVVARMRLLRSGMGGSVRHSVHHGISNRTDSGNAQASRPVWLLHPSLIPSYTDYPSLRRTGRTPGRQNSSSILLQTSDGNEYTRQNSDTDCWAAAEITIAPPVIQMNAGKVMVQEQPPIYERRPRWSPAVGAHSHRPDWTEPDRGRGAATDVSGYITN